MMSHKLSTATILGREGGGGGVDPACMRDNWNKDPLYKGMKAKMNRKCHVSFSHSEGGDSFDYLELVILYFISDPESESISSPELEPESEQPHNDSALLIIFPMPHNDLNSKNGPK